MVNPIRNSYPVRDKISNGVKRISLVIVIFFIFSFFGEHLFAQSEDVRSVKVLILKGAYAQAARECEKILAHYRQAKIKSKLHYLLGICLLQEGRYDKARKNFNIILRHFPRSRFCDDASLGIADSYFLGGDYKRASTKYEQFLQDFPRSKFLSIARKHLALCKQGSPYVNSYFSVQVGCFANKQNAGKLRDELIDTGFQSYILEKAGESLYRVRVGRFSNRLQAELLGQRLKAEGYPTKIFP